MEEKLEIQNQLQSRYLDSHIQLSQEITHIFYIQMLYLKYLALSFNLLYEETQNVYLSINLIFSSVLGYCNSFERGNLHRDEFILEV